MPKKNRSNPWFKKVRGSYLPCSWQGWLTYIPFLAFLLSVLQAASGSEHSAVDTFFVVFPQWIAAAVVMQWIASNKS